MSLGSELGMMPLSLQQPLLPLHVINSAQLCQIPLSLLLQGHDPGLARAKWRLLERVLLHSTSEALEDHVGVYLVVARGE